MAVVNTKSNIITNADATPVTANNPYLIGGRPVAAAATVEVAAADSDTSVYRMIRIPSSARVTRIESLNDAITAGTVYDVGVYQTAENGGAVVDDDLFASAIDMSAARTLPLDVTFEALGIENVEKRLWELLGLSADPHRDYDICYTADTVGSAAGTLSMRAEWVI